MLTLCCRHKCSQVEDGEDRQYLSTAWADNSYARLSKPTPYSAYLTENLESKVLLILASSRTLTTRARLVVTRHPCWLTWERKFSFLVVKSRWPFGQSKHSLNTAPTFRLHMLARPYNWPEYCSQTRLPACPYCTCVSLPVRILCPTLAACAVLLACENLDPRNANPSHLTGPKNTRIDQRIHFCWCHSDVWPNHSSSLRKLSEKSLSKVQIGRRWRSRPQLPGWLAPCLFARLVFLHCELGKAHLIEFRKQSGNSRVAFNVEMTVVSLKRTPTACSYAKWPIQRLIALCAHRTLDGWESYLTRNKRINLRLQLPVQAVRQSPSNPRDLPDKPKWLAQLMGALVWTELPMLMYLENSGDVILVPLWGTICRWCQYCWATSIMAGQ